jgi:hypothetical protein
MAEAISPTISATFFYRSDDLAELRAGLAHEVDPLAHVAAAVGHQRADLSGGF